MPYGARRLPTARERLSCPYWSLVEQRPSGAPATPPATQQAAGPGGNAAGKGAAPRETASGRQLRYAAAFGRENADPAAVA
jgi:hypothetical protein